MSVECGHDSIGSVEAGPCRRCTIYVEDEDGERREKIRELTPEEVARISGAAPEEKRGVLEEVLDDLRRKYPLPTRIVVSEE